jgi:hypothetical protein
MIDSPRNNVQFNLIMETLKEYLETLTGFAVLKPAYYLALLNKSEYLEHFLEKFTYPIIFLGFKSIYTPIAGRINSEIQYKYIIPDGVIAVLNKNDTLDKACEDVIDYGEDLQLSLQQPPAPLQASVNIMLQTVENKPGYAEAFNIDAEGKYYYSFVIPCKMQTWK